MGAAWAALYLEGRSQANCSVSPGASQSWEWQPLQGQPGPGCQSIRIQKIKDVVNTDFRLNHWGGHIVLCFPGQRLERDKFNVLLTAR